MARTAQRPRLATIATLPERLQFALRAIRKRLVELDGAAGMEVERRDLGLALGSLELIDHEIQTGAGRPADQRSVSFAHYLFHEEPDAPLDPNLCDLVVDIEMAYQRAGRCGVVFPKR